MTKKQLVEKIKVLAKEMENNGELYAASILQAAYASIKHGAEKELAELLAFFAKEQIRRLESHFVNITQSQN